jgi:hypothetical protein
MPTWRALTCRWNLASRWLGDTSARREADRHDWLVMVPTGHQYGRFISDLAGFDPVTHNGSDRGLVVAVMTWLATRTDSAGTLSPQQVLKDLPQFRRELRTATKNLGTVAPMGRRGPRRV